MRLSEKIMSLRKKSGWSQEELAERLNVSRQSVSKWELGECSPDIEKILRMSELWNVSTDYLLKEETEEANEVEDTMRAQTVATEEKVSEQVASKKKFQRFLSEPEVNEYLQTVRECAPRIAIGVLLCILSPVCLMLLAVLAEESSLFGGVALIPESVAGGVGLIVLLVMIAIAVAVLILNSMRLSSYEYLEKELVELSESSYQLVEEEKDSYTMTFRYGMTVGVVLCIMGVIPLLCMSIFTEDNLLMVIGVCILLLFVGAGVFLMTMTGMIYASFDKLLQVGDYTPAKKRVEKLSGAYWSLVVALYLFYSFASGNWGASWIIFPVAGVLFGAVSAVIGAIFGRE